MLATGCGGGGSDSGGGSGGSGSTAGGTASDAKPVKGGTLRVADSAEASSLDPYNPAVDNSSVHVFAQIVETLWATTADGEVVPLLLEKATPSKDLKRWTLELRKGVKFSDGKEMSAEDVVFSLETAIKNPTWEGIFGVIAGATAESPTTVVVTTKKPYAALPSTLSLFAAAIVPKDFGGKTQKQFASAPVGTGPFKLAKWDRGQRLTLVRNDRYWRPDRPYLDEVVYLTKPDDASRALELRGRSLDLIADPSWAQIESLDARPDISVGKYAMAFPDLLLFNVKSPLFKDARIREAVDLAVDRDGIVKAALSGQGEKGGSWFPPALRFYKQIDRPRDVAKAKEIATAALAETGAKPAFDFIIRTGDDYARNAAQILKQDLAEIGLTVTIEQLDSAALYEQYQAGKYEAGLFGLTSDIAEPSEVVSFYGQLGSFYTGASPDRVNELLEEALLEPDDDKRGALYGQIQDHVAEERNLLALDYRPWVWAMSDKLVGFDLPPTGIPAFADVGFAE